MPVHFRKLPALVLGGTLLLPLTAGGQSPGGTLDGGDALPIAGERLAGQYSMQQDSQSLALLEAVRHGNAIRVSALLDGVRDINISEADGTTALHYATLQNDLNLMRSLISAGADIHARSRYDVSALYLAALNGSAEAVDLLLEAGADPDTLYSEGQTVLMTAARTGDADTVRRLLEAGATVDAREDWHGQTALMWAAARGHAGLIPLLAEYGAEINARSNEETWERQVTDEPRAKWLPPGAMTPLMFAAREGCLDCIGPLLEHGADIDAAMPETQVTPLLSAISNGHYDVAMTLIEAGADVSQADDTGRSPLYAAIHFNTMPESNRPAPQVHDEQHDTLDLARALLERGADVNRQLDSMIPYRLKLDRGTDGMLVAGTTPFLRAAKDADIAAMTLLLEYGADPFLTTEQGIDPLMTAANHGTKESDTTGRYKTQEQMIAAIRLCLDQGLDINARDNRGQSAVFGAATFGLSQVVRFLHDNGAELDYADSAGLRPLDAAMGKAGGYGFVGMDGVYHEDTVRLIESLTDTEPSPLNEQSQ